MYLRVLNVDSVLTILSSTIHSFFFKPRGGEFFPVLNQLFTYYYAPTNDSSGRDNSIRPEHERRSRQQHKSDGEDPLVHRRGEARDEALGEFRRQRRRRRRQSFFAPPPTTPHEEDIVPARLARQRRVVRTIGTRPPRVAVVVVRRDTDGNRGARFPG